MSYTLIRRRILFPKSHRITGAVIGSTIAVGSLYWSKSKLHADSGNLDKWPKARPLIRESSTQARDTTERADQDSLTSTVSVDSRDTDVSLFEDDDSAAWASFSSQFAVARQHLASIHWPSFRNKIADQVFPQWALALPDYIGKLQTELEMGPDSLAQVIWDEAQDPATNPEIRKEARVRIGSDLCSDEQSFIRRRKNYTTKALAKYLKIPENEINPKDVPTIAVCGSGGGLRALVAGASSYLSAQEVIDCSTYTAGVSGSCWLQTLYNSSIGSCRFERIIRHLKQRIGVHIAYPPDFLELLTKAPTNKYLLSGLVEKLKGDPNASFGLVDAYGLLLAARLLVPKDGLSVFSEDLKLSNQRSYLFQGQNPLPIYTAVRHEIPLGERKKTKGQDVDAAKEKAKQEAWFQWFEFTPYELWCEELGCGIPSWGIGRKYSGGGSVLRKDGLGFPEGGLPFMMGLWGSAFCATLAHYYKEIRPVIKGLGGFGGIDDLMEERNHDLIKLHPVEPGAIPNFALGLKSRLPATCPKSIFESDYLELMDAGMSCNLPLYPLLRKGRDVDIIVCFDASADIKQENWLSVVDGYAKQRGIRGWPVGAGWPKVRDDTKQALEAADSATAQEAAAKIAEAREAQRTPRDSSDTSAFDKTDKSSPTSELGYCNVWVGTTVERTSESEPPPSKLLQPDDDWMLMDPHAGITVVYFPFLPNPKVEGVDPNTSPFMSTWNFIYTPEEVEKVAALAEANFEAGKEQTGRTIKAVYERKKAKRLALEEKQRIRRWNWQLKRDGDHFQ